MPQAAVCGIHDDQISVYGGVGIREDALIESALARPENLAAYGEPEVWDLAAASAYGTAKNHPFVNGDKRTAFVVADVFLARNGFELTASEPDATITFLALAAGDLTEGGLSQWFRSNVKGR